MFKCWRSGLSAQKTNKRTNTHKAEEPVFSRNNKQMKLLNLLFETTFTVAMRMDQERYTKTHGEPFSKS